jgi:prepilin-type N-terminal cleavage/methylation domain
MEQKGFTMIELLVVIVILGVLSLIIYPVINRQMNKSKNDLYESQIKMITTAARNWGADNLGSLPSNDGEQINVTLGALQTLGYIEEKLINPKTKKEFDENIIITIKLENNSLKYSVGL